jgi:hypothetical protein
MSRRRRRKKFKIKVKRKKLPPNKPLEYTKADLRRVAEHFRGNTGWRWFLWCHGFRVKWRWLFVLVFVVVLLLWFFGVDHMKHISIAMMIESAFHQLGARAAGLVEDAVSEEV